MGANSGPPLLLLALAGVALLVGLWLLWRGWRGRRVGDEPICAACGYSLVGRSSDRCPECGADVSRPVGVMYGRRVRGRGAIIVGAIIAFLSGYFLLDAAPGRLKIDWYALKPTGYVLDDLALPNSLNRDRAWGELAKLQKNGTLSSRQYARLVDIALAEQGAQRQATALSRELVEWLGDEALAGRLSAVQKQKFFEQAMRLTLDVRPTVVDGDDAPYRVTHVSRGPAGNPLRWWERVESISDSLDGGPPRPRGGSGSTSGLGGGGSTTMTVPVKGIGRHELKVTVRVEVWSGSNFAIPGPPNKLQHSRDITMTGTLEVVPNIPANQLQHQAPDPVAEARLRAAIVPEGFRYDTVSGPALAGEFKLNSLPVDVAFAVVARVGGKEYPLGTIAQPAGSTTGYYVRGDYDGAADLKSVDLILRPDANAAARTVNLIRIWDGALEFKHVPIKMAGK